MAWREPFVAALSERARAIAYVLEVVEVYNEPGKAYSIASERGLGTNAVGIGAARGSPRVRVEGSSLTPRAWNTTIGAFYVGLVGDFGDFCAHVTCGTVVVLKAGFAGMAIADYETIAIGQVKNIRGVAPAWTVECHDLMTACRQRLDVSYDYAELFASLVAPYAGATTIAADYTAGDATLEVAATTNFRRETSGTGAVKVTPTTGDPFYLTYTGTGTGPIRFTGVGSTGAVGTTAVDAVTGDAVAEVLYLTGHPLDIVRKVLASRDGTNGTYDVLPAYAGLGILHTLIDHDDIDRYRDEVLVVSSGSYAWSVIEDAIVEDAYAWFSKFLAPAGLFLTVRQGLLTVRAAQDSLTAPYLSGIEITDGDIVAIKSYEAYDFRHRPEYGYIAVRANGATSNSTPADLATLPARRYLPYDVTDRVFSNTLNIREEMIDRLTESACRVPERLVVTCAGLRLAQLACGDVVDLSTTRTHSRRDGAAGWAKRRAVVDQVSPDWEGGTVEVGLLVYPETEDAFA